MPIDRSTTPYEIPTDRDFREFDFENVDLEDSVEYFLDESDYLLDNIFDY